MYTLQRYGGMATKHQCPSCGRNKCFVYYVNEDGNALNELVGRCDHQAKCGYHYKPKDFFRDHPTLTVPEQWRQPLPVQERKLWDIREAEVRRFRSNESTLLQYLKGLFGETMVNGIAAVYQLGAVASGATVFWQIDVNGKVRTGKVMAYGNDGHRIKTEGYDRINWMHSLLKKDGLLPDEFEMTQCLFGEHLLRLLPDAPVAIVESEKTAVIMAMVMPEYVWLSTGGKFNLNAERLAPLKGRKVLIYPDADAVEEWRQIVERASNFYNIRLCDLNYTADDITNKRDIADIIINQLKVQDV